MVSFESGVVVADAALHAGLAGKEELWELVERFRAWPGSRRAAAVVSFADGRAESVGESRARVLFHNEGLAAPELQWPIRDDRGRLVGRVDFFWRPRTVGEFDGELKYASGDPKVLFDEKIREDDIREFGNEVVRMVWADLSRPARTAARFRRAIERGSR